MDKISRSTHRVSSYFASIINYWLRTLLKIHHNQEICCHLQKPCGTFIRKKNMTCVSSSKTAMAWSQVEADSKYAKSFDGTWEVLVTEREWREAPRGRPGSAQRLLLAPGEMLELSRSKLMLGSWRGMLGEFPKKRWAYQYMTYNLWTLNDSGISAVTYYNT
jgi:hypothetical protein